MVLFVKKIFLINCFKFNFYFSAHLTLRSYGICKINFVSVHPFRILEWSWKHIDKKKMIYLVVVKFHLTLEVERA
jgi:hypothetical protein